MFCPEDGGSRFFENTANDLGNCGPCGITRVVPKVMSNNFL